MQWHAPLLFTAKKETMGKIVYPQAISAESTNMPPPNMKNGISSRMKTKLTYWLTDGGTRYAVRYEFPRQRWILEGLNDSGMLDPADDIPPPRCFPPPNW